MTQAVERVASCRCGALSATLKGEPVLVSSCCCTQCQRRTGSFFGVTAYFRPQQMVASRGPSQTFQARPDAVTFHFCPTCGSSVWWGPFEHDDVIGLAGGCFADPTLPSPVRMVHTEHKHPYVRPPEGVPTYEGPPPE